jgi:hypothetical protein
MWHLLRPPGQLRPARRLRLYTRLPTLCNRWSGLGRGRGEGLLGRLGRNHGDLGWAESPAWPGFVDDARCRYHSVTKFLIT